MTNTIEAPDTVGVTGHRHYAYSRPDAIWAQQELRRVLLQCQSMGAGMLNSGMATGPDLWAANAADEIGMPTTAFLPFEAESQRVGWPQAWKGLHQRLMAKVIETHVSVTLPEPGHAKATRNAMLDGYHLRNKLLVAHSDVLVAVWNGKTSGGTAHALREAVCSGTPVILLAVKSHRTVTPRAETLAERLEVTLPVAA